MCGKFFKKAVNLDQVHPCICRNLEYWNLLDICEKHLKIKTSY